jgi:hypothetical protein
MNRGSALREAAPGRAARWGYWNGAGAERHDNKRPSSRLKLYWSIARSRSPS